jgi:cyclohexyl-isocyanide hydratase
MIENMKNMKNAKNTIESAVAIDRRELVRRAAGVALAVAAGTSLAARRGAAAEGQAQPPKPKGTMPKHDMSGYGIPDGPPQQIAMLIYPQMTTLDLIGPLQMLDAMGNVQIHLVWKEMGKPVVSDAGVPILPTQTFAECPDNLTVLFAPGGARGTLAVMQDKAVLDFLKAKGKTAKWITSVCTGSLILGAAGLLKGYKATSHWSVRDDILPIFGATPVKERVVEDRNRMTGAGVTAGMDFALRLAAKLRNEKMARAIQLGMEYDPQPPYHAGTLAGAGADVAGMMQAMYYPLQQEMRTAAESVRKQRQ